MVSPITTRHNAFIALALIWLLVCGGLGWATRAGLQVDALEARADYARAREAHEKSYHEALTLAMGRLDWLVESKLGAERARSVDIFLSFYKPAEAYDHQDGSLGLQPPLLRSPLVNLNDPELLLHFQVSVAQGWSSPQLDRGAETAIPAGALPVAERARLASAENWFAALRDRYDAWSLLEVYERAHAAHIEKNAKLRSDLIGERRDSGTEMNHEIAADPKRRTVAEFARRGARLLQLQSKHLPKEMCEPQLVAMDNLQLGDEYTIDSDPMLGCVQVRPNPMLPIWLDLTLDERVQLAMVRSVYVENSQYCTLQGVLIDWRRMKEDLEHEVQDLLPNARIEPVAIGTPPDSNILHTIPARLLSAAPTFTAAVPTSGGITWGLGVTWGVSILALLAISYGAVKYITMLERRMRFVAAVTHELRTPLTSFQLYTDLLADTPADETQKWKDYVATLRKESKRLARLVENVLVYSKIGDARPHFLKMAYAPHVVLDAIARETADQCKSSSKELVVENRCGDDLQIETDREIVVQILSNLVENACKYGGRPEDHRIWLTASPGPAGGVTFEVEDPGTGVVPKDRKAVFEPFRRSESIGGRAAMGLGLGLALSKYWAECLGGRLVLKRGDHNGAHYSRFSLSLPDHIP